MSESTSNLRMPPHNEEAEQSVLGSMMLDRMALSSAMEFLDPESFYRHAHQKIFNAIIVLWLAMNAITQLLTTNSVIDINERLGKIEATEQQEE